jgi:NAD(P)-dependent dehydrogenase (short-subunit alcohol dehydrogenase family)
MQELTGKVAIVTGSARGLGKAIVETLCEAGLSVVGADINQSENLQTAEAIQARGGIVEPVQLDLSDEGQVEAFVSRVVAQYGRLDVVVNNAGVDRTVSVEELSVADWDCIHRVNLRAPFLMAKHAFPIMRKQGSGSIVNVASTAAKRAWPNACAYHSSKWGLLGLSHALHAEGRKENIKVTAVIAGGMRTPFLLDRFPDLDPNLLQDPANVAKTVLFVLQLPDETVIPEITVIPMRETSWP